METNHDTRLESHMSTYHWDMFNVNEQLDMYREMVYKKNELAELELE